MPDLHSRIASELSRRLEVAKAAEEIKPGRWQAHTTHDGVMWTGHSHVRAQEDTAEKRISRPVAYQIADSLDLKQSSLGSDPPPPAITAVFIASNSPADSIRRYSSALRALELHRPVLLRGGPGGKYYETALVCASCSPPQFAEEAWPCQTLLAVAASLGLDTEGSTTDG